MLHDYSEKKSTVRVCIPHPRLRARSKGGMRRATRTSETLYTLSWLLSVVGLMSAVAHCWATRKQRQGWLLASKLILVASIALALPYEWPLALARYRLIGNAVIYGTCAVLLASSFVP